MRFFPVFQSKLLRLLHGHFSTSQTKEQTVSQTAKSETLVIAIRPLEPTVLRSIIATSARPPVCNWQRKRRRSAEAETSLGCQLRQRVSATPTQNAARLEPETLTETQTIKLRESLNCTERTRTIDPYVFATSTSQHFCTDSGTAFSGPILNASLLKSDFSHLHFETPTRPPVLCWAVRLA